MKTIQIKSEPKEKAATPETLVRGMYELLGANMSQITGHSNADWKSDAEFEKWKNEVF